mmetsp:Transcript_34153/g.107672  ORF Transcript_34153/g.107672 Transcript_34153/m.107672 type:complete len:83 (+) Transcript_34153:667-915(+)
MFRCEDCGFTIYPARGREGKFFPKGFTCPNCSASQESFYDLNDPTDPRNQEEDEEEDAGPPGKDPYEDRNAGGGGGKGEPLL